MKEFLAVFTGEPSDGPPQMPPEDIAKGMAEWGKWMQDHAGSLVFTGGPVGRTKSVSSSGIEDIRNNIGGFVIVKAESQEAAARMFEGHPHFTIFPGKSVEVMECLPIPGA